MHIRYKNHRCPIIAKKYKAIIANNASKNQILKLGRPYTVNFDVKLNANHLYYFINFVVT